MSKITVDTAALRQLLFVELQKRQVQGSALLKRCSIAMLTLLHPCDAVW